MIGGGLTRLPTLSTARLVSDQPFSGWVSALHLGHDSMLGDLKSRVAIVNRQPHSSQTKLR